MPALSQNFTFTVNSSTTTSLVYPNTGTTALSYTSDRLKGDGYYGSSDGFHTIQAQVTNFIGKIEVEGTLATAPASNDWFIVELQTNINSVDTTGALTSSNITALNYTTATTNVMAYNFLGNFVWIRIKVSEFTRGTLNGIKYNH